MTAKELIKLLEANPEAEVILSSDEEGNSFGTLNAKGIAVEEKRIILYPWQDYAM
jgi:hypothetical protein